MNYYLIDTDSVKAASLVNYNVEDEAVGCAIRESQDVYLREILGNALLDKCIELASSGTIDDEGYEAYEELVDKYCYQYLVAKAQEQLAQLQAQQYKQNMNNFYIPSDYKIS